MFSNSTIWTNILSNSLIITTFFTFKKWLKTLTNMRRTGKIDFKMASSLCGHLIFPFMAILLLSFLWHLLFGPFTQKIYKLFVVIFLDSSYNIFYSFGSFFKLELWYNLLWISSSTLLLMESTEILISRIFHSSIKPKNIYLLLDSFRPPVLQTIPPIIKEELIFVLYETVTKDADKRKRIFLEFIGDKPILKMILDSLIERLKKSIDEIKKVLEKEKSRILSKSSSSILSLSSFSFFSSLEKPLMAMEMSKRNRNESGTGNEDKECLSIFQPQEKSLMVIIATRIFNSLLNSIQSKKSPLTFPMDNPEEISIKSPPPKVFLASSSKTSTSPSSLSLMKNKESENDNQSEYGNGNDNHCHYPKNSTNSPFGWFWKSYNSYLIEDIIINSSFIDAILVGLSLSSLDEDTHGQLQYSLESIFKVLLNWNDLLHDLVKMDYIENEDCKITILQVNMELEQLLSAFKDYFENINLTMNTRKRMLKFMQKSTI